MVQDRTGDVEKLASKWAAPGLEGGRIVIAVVDKIERGQGRRIRWRESVRRLAAGWSTTGYSHLPASSCRPELWEQRTLV